MNNVRRIAVIDVGKTNAKLVVVDAATGAEVATRSIQNRVVKGGIYPHFDVDALWAFLSKHSSRSPDRQASMRFRSQPMVRRRHCLGMMVLPCR